MGVTVSNVGADWFVKLYKESWFFEDIEEFIPCFSFLLGHRVPFFVKSEKIGYSVFVSDASLGSCSYEAVGVLLADTLKFKQKFGDRARGGFTPPVHDSRDELF